VLGRDVLLKFLPAFAALAFIIPVPGRLRQQVSIPLEAATARVTQRLLLVAGAPVERSGNVLSINGEDVAIAEACNGLRMVSALTLVSYGFAFGAPLKSWTRLIILLASPVSAILCNVIRLVPTVWLYGHRPFGGHADGFHSVAGWVMLGVSFLILLGLLRVLRWAMVPVGHFALAHD
jgi:exosortase